MSMILLNVLLIIVKNASVKHVMKKLNVKNALSVVNSLMYLMKIIKLKDKFKNHLVHWFSMLKYLGINYLGRDFMKIVSVSEDHKWLIKNLLNNENRKKKNHKILKKSKFKLINNLKFKNYKLFNPNKFLKLKKFSKLKNKRPHIIMILGILMMIYLHIN